MNLSLLLPKNPFNVTPEKQTKAVKREGMPMWLQRIAAAAILLLLSPLILTAMLAVKLDSRGPIVFSQVRIGAFGRRFRCYKLRSMYLATDPKFREPNPEESSREGVCKKYVNDPRITPVGRIIRKLSIDELPQLFNVVKGDMALVGPRPHLVSEFEQYDASIYPRLHCQAGLTGLWQVSGRADTTFDEQMSLDNSYVEKQSFIMDMLILLKTVPAVMFAKGAY
ncbi:sugar transferase [Alteromonas sp. ASW11-36]|uniref:Sugar transferase n=1 Tax=Alteromonas arenosi TaxID=3055817 RepID=A0ABT7SSZ3_9ALTE|nr:sugar transferase [Alteromonas sp. ASW11-36]MDM7859317.1 sugar transferase [Alteromonas sp. ASW11-36]